MSEALRLADWLDHHGEKACHADAAAELRRLHTLNAELAGALTSIAKNTCCGDCQEARRVAGAVLAKVEASNGS